MTLQQLEYIVALADHRQFVSAAESLGITQSTLSLMVKKLEEELDVVIFNRSSHPLKLTAIGKKIVATSRTVLAGAKKIKEIPKTEKEVMSGTLHLAMISTVSFILMPGMFKYFREKWPNLSLEAEEMLSESIIEKIMYGEVDVGIVNSPVKNSDLFEIPLYTESFLAYVSPKDPAHSMSEIPRSELLDHSVWVIKNGVKLLDDKYFEKREHFSYESMYEGGRVGVLISIVNDSGGLTIIPKTHTSLLMHGHQANIRPIVNPVPTRTISLVVRRDYVHEKLLNEVIRSVKKNSPSGVVL
jgi:Transcriptional regulator